MFPGCDPDPQSWKSLDPQWNQSGSETVVAIFRIIIIRIRIFLKEDIFHPMLLHYRAIRSASNSQSWINVFITYYKYSLLFIRNSYVTSYCVSLIQSLPAILSRLLTLSRSGCSKNIGFLIFLKFLFVVV